MAFDSLTCCLWFNGQAEEAARFYVSVFHDSSLGQILLSPADYPAGKTGDVLTVDFTLMGRPFVALNAGPNFRFNEAISFQIPVETQKEADRYYEALSAVPEAEQCGWVKDRYGLSWQIVPVQLIAGIKDSDRAKAKRVFEAMSQMTRIDVAKILEIARG